MKQKVPKEQLVAVRSCRRARLSQLDRVLGMEVEGDLEETARNELDCATKTSRVI
jgi:hypothetical protein